MQNDNKALSIIIRNALEVFGANKRALFFMIQQLIILYELLQLSGSVYYVALVNDMVSALKLD